MEPCECEAMWDEDIKAGKVDPAKVIEELREEKMEQAKLPHGPEDLDWYDHTSEILQRYI
jgi:hypothetical protein